VSECPPERPTPSVAASDTDLAEVCLAQSDGATLGLAGEAAWGECREEAGSAMSGELPPDGPDDAEAPGELPQTYVSARRTPDESTMGLPSSAEPLPLPSSEADLPRLQPGELLAGRFAILHFIAQGGMGAVYEANDVMLRSRVALKAIRGRIATDAAAMERFRREVLLARRVGHPNVCHVFELYDATTAAGVPIHFLTMELLEGETLSQRIARQGPLTTVEALPLVQQMCEGLAAAHAEGVIHRDFKSSNVMLVSRREGSGDSTTPSTRVAITDFGIARAVQLGGGQTSDERLTGGAGILGTPEYMAPEQVTGGTVTKAADIYALGVVLYEVVTGKLPFAGNTPLAAAAKRLTEAPPRPEETTPGLDARWSATILRCLAREPERRFNSALEIVPELERPLRSRPRLSTVNALVLAGLAVGVAFGGYIAFASFRKPSPHAAVPTAPRPVLAILGFRDELASPELAWLPTAVSEALGLELAATETSLRVIPGDRVAKVRRSLGVSADAVNEANVRKRIEGLLAANVLVYGALKPMANGSASVELSVKLVDASDGRELVSLDEDLGEGAGALTEKVSSIAERLRQTLGAPLSQEQSAALSASRASNLSAMKSYAQGVISLRKFEYENAKGDFEAALAMDGSFLAAKRRVVELWEHEGNRKRSLAAAEAVRSRPSGLTPRQRLEVEAKILSLGTDPAKGREARKALFDATPDDVELGLALVDDEDWNNSPKAMGAIISRLRALPAPTSRDIRFELTEGSVAASLGNPNRAKELLTEAEARARAMGARTETALALKAKAVVLFISEGRAVEAAEPFQEAATLLSVVGELDELADVKIWQANLAASDSPSSSALKSLEDTAALQRRLGRRAQLHWALADEAGKLHDRGDLELAATKLREALLESEAIGEAPDPQYSIVKGYLDLDEADMEGVRKALRTLRTESNLSGPGEAEPYALWLEADAFRAQDRLSEARENLEKRRTFMETNGRALEAFEAQTELCDLACDEGHPLQGVECLSRHPPPAEVSTSWSVPIGRMLSMCRYLAGDLQGAERAGAEAVVAAQRWELYQERVRANGYLMRARAARGGTAKAIASLRADLTEAESKGAKSVAFEVALALGEVELRAGRSEGRRRLLKLEQEAKSKEFFRIARLAREALDGKPAAATPGK
jgi:eukaryotic-like serine/threonine-protein kinase